MEFGPLLVIYLLGASVLYFCLRFFAQARGHAGLSAAAFLAMFSLGGLVAGGLFAAYITRPVPPIRPVGAFAGTLVLASLLMGFLGVLLVRRRIPHPGRAVAIAVISMAAAACAMCATPLRMAERKFAFMRQVDELQRLAPLICAEWEQNGFRGLPAVKSTWADAHLRTDILPEADLETLPDYWARQGFP